jgi:hypothetical protein
MRSEGAPGLQCFIGVGCLIVAWRFAPGGEFDPLLYFFSGVFAASGAIMLTVGMLRANASPSPLSGLLGRAVWALRPRTWMIAWAIIVGLVQLFGTPHLLWQYPIGPGIAACDYVGWSGVQRWEGTSGNCTPLKLF